MKTTGRSGKGGRRKLVRPGRVSAAMVHEWVVERKGVILRGGELDEAAHGDTIEVQHTLRPLIVVMAGANEFDPYKD